MPVQKAGEKFDLTKDSEILKINSPAWGVTGGPYKIIYKDTNSRWVIVALNWQNNPALGIRWFWRAGGEPSSRGYATWQILPTELYKGILASFDLDYAFTAKIYDFLAGKITGEELEKYNP